MKTFLFSRTLPTLAGAALALLPLSSQAAAITWGTPTTVTAATDIQSAGVTNLAGANFGLTNGTTTTVNNGAVNIDFKSMLSSQTVTLGNGVTVAATGYNFNVACSAPAGVIGNYRTVMTQQMGVGGGAGTIHLGGLVIGTRYQIQAYITGSDPNISNISGSPSLTAGGYNNPNNNSGYGQYIVGTFTADATSQSLTQTANTTEPVINALTIGVLPPPPGTIIWGAPTNITDASNIESAGMINIAGANFGVTTGTTTVVNNGSLDVEFKSLRSGQNATLSNGINVAADATWANWGFNSGNSNMSGNFGVVLDTNIGKEEQTPLSGVLTLSNLVAGMEYRIQCFVSATASTTEYISGSGALNPKNAGYGQYVVGKFTAATTTQLVTVFGLNNNFMVVNALTIGELPIPIVSPSIPNINEEFSMATGNLNGLAAGTGLLGNWTASTNPAMTVASDTLSYGTTLPVSANKISGEAGTYAMVSPGSTLSNAGLLSNGKTLWFSFLYHSTSPTANSNDQAAFALGTERINSVNLIPLLNSGSGIGVSIDNETLAMPTRWVNGSRTTGTSQTIDLGLTRLIVGKIQWGATDTADETITIYLPNTDLELPTGVSASSPALNQSTFDTISFAQKGNAGPIASIDQIRFGATYQAVVAANSWGILDTDGDGMEDNWEITYFGNLSHNGTGDDDGDTLSDLVEYQAGLNPNDADSDDDGTNDSIGIRGFLLAERWDNIPGGTLNDLKTSQLFYGPPSDAYLRPLAKAVTGEGDSYGLRMRGRVIAPITGDYQFWIAGDERCELWLSTDSSKFNKRVIARVDAPTGEEAWDNTPIQKSVLISLTAGQEYYIEVLQKENSGQDHVAVAWEYSGQARQVIPGVQLRSYVMDALDDDDDGLPDAWEIQSGLNPSDNGAVNQANGEYGDPDTDGFTNFEEFCNKTYPVCPNGMRGTLQRDTWSNLSGGSIADLTRAPAFLEASSVRDASIAWQTVNRSDYYGQRLRGFYTTRNTGWHTFWIAGDDGCALYLNDGSLASGPNAAFNRSWRKFGKRLIASIGGEDYHINPLRSGTEEYDKFPSQKSASIWLTAGVPYYLEVLHKEHNSLDRCCVAVQAPYYNRIKIPFSDLTAFLRDDDDQDDDDLPDTWESQNWAAAGQPAKHLDPADNGRYNRGIEGALGDADSDQLTNREEYLLGTNPMNADSDGDSITDYVETRSIGSDPTLANSGLGAVLTDIAGSAGTATNGEWITGPNDTLLSLERRGAAAWNFTLETSGWKILEVLATPQGNTWAGTPLTVVLTITRPSDNKKWDIGEFPLRDDEGQPTRILALLPSLPAGNYSASIAIRNVSESRNLRIDRLRILSPAGADVNQNGIPDWIETRLGDQNTLISANSSAVSPACVEGIARDVAKSWLTVNGQNVSLIPGINNRWFANLSLPVDGSVQLLTASYEDSSLVQDHAIAWTPTNLIASTSLTIRLGDKMRLTAHPGATPDTGVVRITGAGADIETTANLPVVREFTTAGNFTLTATHTAANNTVTTSNVALRVVAPDFGDPLLVRTDRWRDWTLSTSIAADLPIQWDSRLTVSESSPLNGARRLKVAAAGDQPVHLVARTAADSSIAAVGTVDPYLIGDPYDTGFVELLETLPDGMLHGRISVVADRLPPNGGYLEIQLWAGGALFADGTSLKQLNAAAFDGNGVALVDVYFSSQSSMSSLCAYYRLKDKDGNLLSEY